MAWESQQKHSLLAAKTLKVLELGDVSSLIGLIMHRQVACKGDPQSFVPTFSSPGTTSVGAMAVV